MLFRSFTTIDLLLTNNPGRYYEVQTFPLQGWRLARDGASVQLSMAISVQFCVAVDKLSNDSPGVHHYCYFRHICFRHEGGGTIDSTTPGTFDSDTRGTFNPLPSHYSTL